MDGHIRIKTKLDNSEIPKDLDEMVKELERLKQEQKELNDEAKKLDLNAKGYEKNASYVKKQIKELEKELEKLKMLQEISVYQPEEYADYGKQVAQKQQEIDLLKQEEDAYDKTLGQLEQAKYKLEENKEAQEQWNKRIGETKERLAHSDGIKTAISDIGTRIKKTLKQTLKWGLAILSIRSAYMMIRQAASTLSQYNDELRTKIEGIRLALASALEPVIVKIVDFVIELLRYVNAISVSLFGWDLFKNAKNMKSMSKSAKEIKNSLAGFDEMNVLADASSSAGGSGKFDIDLSPKDLDTSVFYNWIDKVREIINKGFEGIKNNVVKVLEELKIPKVVIDVWVASVDFIKGLINGLLITVKGALELIIGFFTGDTEKVKEGFKTMLAGITTALLSFVNYGRNLVKAGINFVLGLFKSLWEGIKKIFSTVGSFFEGIWNTIKSKFTKIGTSIGEAVSSAFKTVINSVITFAQNTINKFIKAINKAISAINVIPGVNIKKITEINIPKLATGGIVNRPTYAQIGEAGREAVLPLDRNTEWMNELAKKINSNGGVVNVYLDGRLIQRQYNQRQEEFNFATNGGM